MGDALGGKKIPLGGHKTTDGRLSGRGDNISGAQTGTAKVKVGAYGGGKHQLNPKFRKSADTARTAMPRTAAPPKTDFTKGA
jgi:hypothetical protein